MLNLKRDPFTHCKALSRNCGRVVLLSLVAIFHTPTASRHLSISIQRANAAQQFPPQPLVESNIYPNLPTMSDPSRHKRRKVHVEMPLLLRPLASYNRDVSPPPIGNHAATDPATFDDENDPLKDFFRSAVAPAPKDIVDLTADKPDAKDINGPGFRHGQPESSTATANSGTQTWSSPFRLTKIRDLPQSENRDTIGIAEILGDVMLREVWLFNYMHNIHWVMAQFDLDISTHVKIVFVHGNWKQEDEGRKRMEVGGLRWLSEQAECGSRKRPRAIPTSSWSPHTCPKHLVHIIPRQWCSSEETIWHSMSSHSRIQFAQY